MDIIQVNMIAWLSLWHCQATVIIVLVQLACDAGVDNLPVSVSRQMIQDIRHLQVLINHQ